MALMVGGGGLVMTTENCKETGTGVGALSVTVTMKLNVPASVGVPLREPSVPSVRPLGNAPVISFQVSGSNPPLAVKLYPGYTVPLTPAGGLGIGAMTGSPGSAIATVKDCGTDCGVWALSVAMTVKVEETAVGATVPVIEPSGPRVRPAGNAPDFRLQVNGRDPPVAATAKLG